MDTVHIRAATLEDLKAIQVLSTELAHSDIPFDKDIDLNWAYTDDGKKYYREKIEHHLCCVAVDNNSIIGYITFAVKEVPTWRLVKVAELENLFVTEKRRSKGVGQQLMNAFLSWAKDNNANRASVSVFFPNDGAVKFYKRHGLKEYDLNLEMEL